MKRIRIWHLTEYTYSEPVRFGAHRIRVRPREGHDVHIESSVLKLSPPAQVRWIRDMVGNSIAVATFDASAKSEALRIESEVVVRHYDQNPLDFVINPDAASYPFRYFQDEQTDLIPYLLTTYPRDERVLSKWLRSYYEPGKVIGTFELLSGLNRGIYDSLTYVRREEQGVQSPAATLTRGAGSCRDYATLMMEAARLWGFAARFVSGYLESRTGQHGATHAWTEIYIPGAGWRGFDPTNNTFAGSEHVSVAVDRDPERAAPISGSWMGSTATSSWMNVSVVVTRL